MKDIQTKSIWSVVGATVAAAAALGFSYLSQDTTATLIAKGIAHYCVLAPDAREDFKVKIQKALAEQGFSYVPDLCADE